MVMGRGGRELLYKAVKHQKRCWKFNSAAELQKQAETRGEVPQTEKCLHPRTATGLGRDSSGAAGFRNTVQWLKIWFHGTFFYQTSPGQMLLQTKEHERKSDPPTLASPLSESTGNTGCRFPTAGQRGC